MSHKDAPPLTPEQARMEAFYNARLNPRGVTVGWGRDKDGNYLAEYARDAWAAWNMTQLAEAPIPNAPNKIEYIVASPPSQQPRWFFIADWDAETRLFVIRDPIKPDRPDSQEQAG